jgi:hypothetical protein
LFADLVRAAGGGRGLRTGHVPAHPRGLGVNAFGIDLSPAMIEPARRERPVRKPPVVMSLLRVREATPRPPTACTG